MIVEQEINMTYDFDIYSRFYIPFGYYLGNLLLMTLVLIGMWNGPRFGV